MTCSQPLRRVLALFCAAIVSTCLANSVHAVIVVDDSFADVDRTKTGALDADWWSSNSTSGNSIEIDANGLGLVTGTSGRGIHGTFAPQTLSVGQTIIATYTFTTPVSVGTNRGGAFKVALMDGSNPGLAADLHSSSSTPPGPNPLYVGLPGYHTDFDVNTGTEADVSIRKHDILDPQGRFLGTSSEWDSLGSSSDAGYTFAANTEYMGIFSITRTDTDEVEIFSSISQNGTLMDSNTETDSSAIANSYGMLGFWANSNTFGSSTSKGVDVDNGITFSNITVSVVPEPSAFLMVGLVFGVVRMIKRRG